MSKKLYILSLLLLFFLIGGCSQIELASHFGKKMTGSSVKSQGKYKVGSPYKIKGKKYYPAVDYNYNRTGIASWYGPNFHGKKTANGEIFDQNELTAAHKTLPLPSIVRVTNLENGRSLIVRVNDRGPYAYGRIIDMSKRAAELLGFKNKGVAKVRVQVLEAESRYVAQLAKSGRSTNGIEVPMNHPSYKSPNVSSNVKYVSNNKAVSHKQYIPGHIKNGAFYPDPVISEFPVKTQNIFVQVGAFSTRESAMNYASSLDKFGRAQIYPIIINDKEYFRVRFPTTSVSIADSLLKKLVDNGYKNALIIVD